MQGSSLELHSGYYLEPRRADLRSVCLHPLMVGAFSAWGAIPGAVRQTVEDIIQRQPSVHSREAPNPLAIQPTLRVRFFGHFEMLCDEEVISLGRNGKALAILKYLLGHRSRPVSQDHLMGWLWPESNLKKARWSLNSTIHSLRKLLGDCSSLAPVNYILLEEGYYRLFSDVRVITDVDEFDARYEEGRRLAKEGRTEEAAAEYEKAIALYRGDYLVEDLYEDWTMVERERLIDAYIDMLSQLATHYYETGLCQESIRARYGILEKNRSHEESYRLLMRCYARLGLRDRALRQYRLCKRVLRQEYDTAPSPETEALYGDLLSGHHQR
jgi:DNA-binding SARP family transcriptional activator